MKKLFRQKILGISLAIFGFSNLSFLAFPSFANSPKNCVPVARSLETKKTYCAHEFQGLSQEKARNRDGGVLCFILNRIVPLKQIFSLDQCVAEDANLRFDAKGKRIIPKIKGASDKFEILQPLGNLLVEAQPDIAWHPIDSASYRVTITEGGNWVWSQTTRQSSLKLPKTLLRGKIYNIKVVALVNDQAIAEQFKTLTLADPQLLKGIDQTISNIHGGSSDPVTKGIDRALLLYHANLWDAAIGQLKSLTYLQKPSIHQQLASIYKELGHEKLSMAYDQKAVELANQNKPSSQQN